MKFEARREDHRPTTFSLSESMQSTFVGLCLCTRSVREHSRWTNGDDTHEKCMQFLYRCNVCYQSFLWHNTAPFGGWHSWGLWKVLQTYKFQACNIRKTLQNNGEEDSEEEDEQEDSEAQTEIFTDMMTDEVAANSLFRFFSFHCTIVLAIAARIPLHHTTCISNSLYPLYSNTGA